MRFQRYLEQAADWPQSGRHILAQFDGESVYVYQAYRSSIARFAVENQAFGGDFSFSRMSWIKPNFLWPQRARVEHRDAEVGLHGALYRTSKGGLPTNLALTETRAAQLDSIAQLTSADGYGAGPE